MESVVIKVPRRRSIHGGDAFDVFGDRGSGTLDTDVPLTDRPIPFWGGLPTACGHLCDGHLSGLHLDQLMPDGHLAGRHLSAEHLWPAAEVSFATRPLYFGAFQFAVGMVDANRNRSTVTFPVVTRVLNSSPRPASSLKQAGFDAIERRMSFTFSPSPDL